MSSEGVNATRRNLLVATGVLGAAGAAGLAIPFVRMWTPSERAKAAGAPVLVQLDKLEPGQRIKAEWRGKAIYVVRRTESMLETLSNTEGRLKDPDSEVIEQQPEYAKNQYRSSKPEYLVLVAVCTHLGCAPLFEPEVESKPYDAEWQGGFYCPCHNSRFDLAGRVFNGSPAPTNLAVPPYSFVSDAELLIGVSPEGAA